MEDLNGSSPTNSSSGGARPPGYSDQEMLLMLLMLGELLTLLTLLTPANPLVPQAACPCARW